MGLLGAFLSGGCYPALGILWAEMTIIFYATDADGMRVRSYWFAAAWVGLGVAQTLFAWMQYGGFGAAGQSLTRKLRQASFTALLAQEVAYFDQEVRSGHIFIPVQSESGVGLGLGLRLGLGFACLDPSPKVSVRDQDTALRVLWRGGECELAT